MARASSKHDRGNVLGNNVTGAVTARDLEESMFAGIRVFDGRTARPLKIDQSLMFEIRYSACCVVREGGYSEAKDSAATAVDVVSPSFSVNILMVFSGQSKSWE